MKTIAFRWPSPRSAQRRTHTRIPALVAISDAQAGLTRIEDGLETIIDVLVEMRSLAAEAATLRDAAISEKKDGMWRWINPDRRRSTGNALARHALHSDRLSELSHEIDDILGDIRNADTPLLGDQPATFTLLVTASDDDSIDASVEPPGAAVLSAAFDDLRGFYFEEADIPVDYVDRVIVHVQAHLDRLVDYRDRLTTGYKNLLMSWGVDGAGLNELKDADSVRVQLEITKLQIAEESNKSLLAQANGTSQAAIRLIETMYRSDDRGPLARIYLLDHECESARCEGPALP